MHKKRNLAKNTVEQQNIDFSLYQFYPKQSVGPFVFGSSINDYLKFYHNTYFPAGKYGTYESYYFLDPPITIFPKEGMIGSISCDDYLFFNGNNIIGMNVFSFLKNNDLEYESKERLYVMREDHIKSMVVYDVDEIGALLWTYRNKIILVSCSNYKE